MALLAELKLEVETDDDEPSWVFLPEPDIQLTFSTDEPQRLLQIEVDEPQLRFGTLPVLGEPVHKIVELLQIPPAETLWRPVAPIDVHFGLSLVRDLDCGNLLRVRFSAMGTE